MLESLSAVAFSQSDGGNMHENSATPVISWKEQARVVHRQRTLGVYGAGNDCYSGSHVA